MIKLFYKIFYKSIIKNNTNITQSNIDNILDFIEINNLIFYNKKNYQQNDSVLFKYNRLLNEINIPNNFLKNTENKKIYEEAQNNFKENALI